jgi:hypothetical protein
VPARGAVRACRDGPRSNRHVGAQALPLVIVRIAARRTERVPLLIATASYTPRLGYAVPPGEWGILATLTFGQDPRDSPLRRTPVMPLTITA